MTDMTGLKRVRRSAPTVANVHFNVKQITYIKKLDSSPK